MDFKEQLSELCRRNNDGDSRVIWAIETLLGEHRHEILALLDAVDEEIMFDVGKKMFPKTTQARAELGGDGDVV